MLEHIYMTDHGEFPIKGRMARKIAAEEVHIPDRMTANPFVSDAPPIRFKAEDDYSPLVQRYFRKIKAHMKAQWESEASKLDAL